ncbi:MAG: multicopper oxidase family protein [Gammaproteobacteria bacterium]
MALSGACVTDRHQSSRKVDPRVVEINLVAARQAVDLTGSGLMANAYTLNGKVPGPELRLHVGDTAVVHFRNELPELTTVHWHGIELDNVNDGTSVTQDPVRPGESFDYRFKVTRPGVFWYHSHAMPSNPEFKGFYGAIVVTDDSDARLVEKQVLPDADQTWTLVLSDTTVCKKPGMNDTATFAADPSRPWAFTARLGPFPGLVAYPSPVDLCEAPRDRHGVFTDTGPLAEGEIPNIQPATSCSAGGNTFGMESRKSCRVNEGQLVLTNGVVAAARAGTPENPGALQGDRDVFAVEPGSGVRLRLVNAAVSRYFRLRLTDQSGKQQTIYRVGGQGGVLDRVIVEGGQIGQLDTKFERGEILLGVAERTDVVIRIPDTAKPGSVLTLWTLDYQHYGTAEYPYGYGGLPTVPVAHFRVAEGADTARYAIAEGDPLRLHPAVNDPVESIKTLTIDRHLLDPASFAAPAIGTPEEEILLTVVGLKHTIDGVFGTVLEQGAADYRDIPHLQSSRYAAVGDTLELTFYNGTQMHHPMHLHGFSFQPLRITDVNNNTVYQYDYNEFVDTVDVPSLYKLVMRVRLADRPIFATGLPGGAKGRWLLHCHIFPHAALGMMSELVVVDPATVQ